MSLFLILIFFFLNTKGQYGVNTDHPVTSKRETHISQTVKQASENNYHNKYLHFIYLHLIRVILKGVWQDVLNNTCINQRKERGSSSITRTVSKATLGKRLRDGVERIWAFSSI